MRTFFPGTLRGFRWHFLDFVPDWSGGCVCVHVCVRVSTLRFGHRAFFVGFKFSCTYDMGEKSIESCRALAHSFRRDFARYLAGALRTRRLRPKKLRSGGCSAHPRAPPKTPFRLIPYTYVKRHDVIPLVLTLALFRFSDFYLFSGLRSMKML